MEEVTNDRKEVKHRAIVTLFPRRLSIVLCSPCFLMPIIAYDALYALDPIKSLGMFTLVHGTGNQWSNEFNKTDIRLP